MLPDPFEIIRLSKQYKVYLKAVRKIIKLGINLA